MTDRDALTTDWLQAERRAIEAELTLASHGQASNSPEYRDAAMLATQLRRAADDLFTRLHAHLRDPRPET
ncbi:hypothetical protein [Ramlibacter algicola]|uniref:Uncharacterized protein n=1 Tax=Ramlibacter algicola TaxID=2795217 RepID=A0A934Q4P1_9BURK|nr:hypothetical protein [Ramlibacter algicola]MBK0394848.1 hypothetical protein [Ramlibacter algicola]